MNYRLIKCNFRNFCNHLRSQKYGQNKYIKLIEKAKLEFESIRSISIPNLNIAVRLCMRT